MTKKSPLQLKAAETIRFLTAEGLITKEHSLTVALIKELTAEWAECTNSTQRAAISKELRQAIAMLPQTEATATDEAQAFLDSLTEDA